MESLGAASDEEGLAGAAGGADGTEGCAAGAAVLARPKRRRWPRSPWRALRPGARRGANEGAFLAARVSSRWGARVVCGCALLLASCSADEEPSGIGGEGGATVTGGGGGGGGHVTTCRPGEVVDADGQCVRSGVPRELCPSGFEPDEVGGCDPLLPPEPCPSGRLALPGQDTCHPLVDCGDAPWGVIPVDEATLHVDGSYAGTDSDGSAARPFSAIQAAIDVASPGSLIAVAAGTYVDDLRIIEKPVRLWGRCPQLVSLELADSWAVGIQEADGTELRGLAMTGIGYGVFVRDADDVVLDTVWIHDTADVGLLLRGESRPLSVTVSNSLIEGTTGAGVALIGGTLTMTRSVVRRIQSDPYLSGRGIDAQPSLPGNPAAVTIRESVISESREAGIAAFGAEVVLNASVVQATLPRESDGRFGVGVQLQPMAGPSTAAIDGSVIRGNRSFGLSVLGSSASVDLGTVADTAAQHDDGLFGDAITVGSTSASPAELTIDRSAVARAARAGVTSFSAAASIGRSALACNPIDLDGEATDGPYQFVDAGLNACFCGDGTSPCRVVSSSLQPPEGL